MINLEKFNITKQDKILIGVSGGPDSMSLLDMVYQLGYDVIVCHVNYHKRKSAKRDENIVKEYCATHSIPFYLADCYELEGNFQDKARDFRYEFFYKIYQENKCSCLLTAHQLNDALETYLFKKQRNSKGRSLSILEEDYIYNMRVIRPLLDSYKKDLITYCVTHSIEYGIDETNFKNKYTRNKIRKEIENLDQNSINNLINEMRKDEEKWHKNYIFVSSFINKNSINLDDFDQFSDENKQIALIELINRNCLKLANNLSLNKINNYIDSIKAKTKKYFLLEDDLYLVVNNKISIVKNEKIEPIIINNFNEAEEFFEKSGEKMDGIFVDENDFPLTIRSFNEKDVIEIKNGHKEVKKLFNEKKIDKISRNSYPILINNNLKILLIRGLYKDPSRRKLKNNLYMLKSIKYK